jgi:hypothetical protein
MTKTYLQFGILVIGIYLSFVFWDLGIFRLAFKNFDNPISTGA